MEHWGPFLEARMKIIQEFRRNGQSSEQIEDLINIHGMQTVFLVNEADRRNRTEAH